MKTDLLPATTTAPQEPTLHHSVTPALHRSLTLPILSLFLLALAPAAQAQFRFVTNNGAITITAYTGPGGAVTIPATTNGLPVTCIGDDAFGSCATLTSVTIPNTITNIGLAAFEYCKSLRSVTIPASVTTIGYAAFYSCYSLTNLTIPAGVTSIGDYAFQYCFSLTQVYFGGNTPTLGASVFDYDTKATVYYLPGTTGWGSTFAGCPTVLWNPQALTSSPTFGVHTNGFGFTITGPSNLVIVVEASSNLANSAWSPVGTNTLTNGSSYFIDPRWTNYPARFYRFRSP